MPSVNAEKEILTVSDYFMNSWNLNFFDIFLDINYWYNNKWFEFLSEKWKYCDENEHEWY